MKKITTFIMAFALLALPAISFAQGAGNDSGTSVSATADVRVQAGLSNENDSSEADQRSEVRVNSDIEVRADVSGVQFERARDRAEGEIDRRIERLEAIKIRVESMARLSAESKASLMANIDGQIQTLTDLGVKVQSDTSTTSLRANIDSVKSSYRVFALTIPKSTIIASADRVLSVSDQMTSFSAKLSERIEAAASSGVDVSALIEAQARLDASIASAKSSATTASNTVSSLSVNADSQVAFEANITAMKEARKTIQVAQQHIVSARKEASAIIKGVKGVNISVKVQAGADIESN